MRDKRQIESILRQEFLEGRNWFDWTFLVLGLGVQVAVYLIEPGNPWALVSGLLGIISVILCSQGKISTFAFGFLQIATYLYVCLLQRLYGEVAINAFYFLSQIYGIYAWRKRYRKTSDTSVATFLPKKMRLWQFAILFLLTMFLSVATGYGLARFTDDTQPWLDAFTTVPALVAQCLMVMAYKEQWYLWILVDVLSAAMWFRAGEYTLLAQYIFWLANCVYGYYNWTRGTQSDREVLP